MYGLSCGLVWGHTGRDWDRLSDLAGSWVDRALEEHERAQVPAAVQEDSRGLRSGERLDRERAAREVEPLTILIFGKTYGSAYWELVVAETVGGTSPPTEATYFYKRSEVGKRVRRAVADQIIDPSTKDAKQAHLENLAVLCDVHCALPAATEPAQPEAAGLSLRRQVDDFR